jgi:hypothetical protein
MLVRRVLLPTQVLLLLSLKDLRPRIMLIQTRQTETMRQLTSGSLFTLLNISLNCARLHAYLKITYDPVAYLHEMKSELARA